MKRYSSQLTLVAVSLACMLALVACTSGGGPKLQYITISPQGALISVGGTQQYSAQAYYSDGTIQDGTGLVTWSSSTTSVATITSGGLATGVANGTTTISAAAAGTSGTTATLTVNTLSSIAVTPLNPQVEMGATQQFTATGTFTAAGGGTSTSDITSQVEWSSGTLSVATITTGGLASAVASTGTSVIKATLLGVSGQTTLTATGSTPHPVSLQLTPGTPSIPVGGSQAFTVMELWSDSSLHTPSGIVTFTTSDATVAGIDATKGIGLGVKAGSVTITANEDTPTISGQATLTVVAGVTNFAYISNLDDNSVGYYQVDASSATPLTSPQTVALSNNLGATQTIVHPSGLYLYVTDINSNVHIMTVDGTGAPTETGIVPTLPGPANSVGFNFGAVDPFGRFLYVSNDNSETIYGFTIDQATGNLTQIGTGPLLTGAGDSLSVPEQVIIERTGKYLYAINDGDGNVSAYSINQSTGALTALSTPTYATGSGPVFGALDPTGTHLFVANSVDNTVSAFTLNTSNGSLTPGATTTVTGAVVLLNVIVSPAGNSLYVLDVGTLPSNIYGYALNNGVVGSAIGGLPIAAGNDSTGMAIDATGALLAVDNSSDNDISLYTIGAGGALSAKTPPTVGAGTTDLFITFLNAAAAPSAATKKNGTKN